MFCWKGYIYFIDKPWNARPPTLYRSDLGSSGQEPESLGPLPIQALITGADIAADGTRIALTSYRAVFVFQGEGDPAETLKKEPLVSPLNARQIEGVTWLGDALILSNEQRDIF